MQWDPKYGLELPTQPSSFFIMTPDMHCSIKEYWPSKVDNSHTKESPPHACVFVAIHLWILPFMDGISMEGEKLHSICCIPTVDAVIHGWQEMWGYHSIHLVAGFYHPWRTAMLSMGLEKLG